MIERILWGVLTLFVVLAFIIGVAAGCDPAPAEQTGVELEVDIDRAKTRAPLKTKAPAPTMTRKAVKR